MTDQQIRVWAPLASGVEALIHGPGTLDAPGAIVERHALARDEGGHWTLTLPAGTDYLLSVDADEPRPDPRSPRQPYGVHGPSRTFDAQAHTWTDTDWVGAPVLGGVLYELHVGSFTTDGTLDAAIERLDHLVALGVDTVELMPVVPFPGDRGWGYDGVSLFAVHERYGGPAALQRFVDAAHARGLAVCLDVVYNHFGPAGNYAPAFGPYFTTRHHTPWGAAINLDDEHADGVRAFIIDNALRWLADFHIDALRLDAVHALVDDSARHILAELSDAVAAWEASAGRTATLIAESDLNQVSMVTPTAEGGLGMDGQWADDIHHALHSWLTGDTFGYYVDFGSADVLAKAFERVFVHDGELSTFRGKPWGAPVPDEVDRRRFVTFTQNHDQVGNRGLGDRPDASIPPGVVAGGAALLLLSPFTPLLFQGQEWGTTRPFQFFTDHDPELGALVTQGRLREFAEHGWAELYGPDAPIPDPQSPEALQASTLDWSEPDQKIHAALLAWHTDLIALRRDALAGGGHPVSTAHGADWFRLDHGPLTVVVNRAEDPVDVPGCPGQLALRHGTADHDGDNLRLGSYSVAVLRH